MSTFLRRANPDSEQGASAQLGVSAQPVRRPAPRDRAQASSRLYRAVWRWHFYAGLFVAPVLMVMAATGAMYVFKDEIESVMYADMMHVEPAAGRVTIDEQLATARLHCPAGYEIRQFEVPAEATDSTIFFAGRDDDFRSLFVDPYRGNYLGELNDGSLFAIVLRIHRTLFVGTLGRVVVELVTCWAIVLFSTGLYLWWPRRRSKVWGAWLPRFGRNAYLTLRDLHAVSGAYVAGVALLIAATGLLYTQVWGTGYNLAAVQTGAYDIFLKPPQSLSPAESPRAPLEQVVAVAKAALPGNTLSVTIPADPAGAFVVFGSRHVGPSSDGVVVVDHATTKVLGQRATSDYPALGWWASWNYPLHVGSVLGLPTKIVWLVTSIVLTILPVTGVWMWWHRRPRGRTGFPNHPDVRLPKALVATIVALCLALPMMGASLLVILSAESAFARWRSRRAALV